jgi:hypothetical protein
VSIFQWYRWQHLWRMITWVTCQCPLSRWYTHVVDQVGIADITSGNHQ